MSSVYVAITYYDGLFSKIVIITGVVFVGLITFIIVNVYIKKQIVSQSRFPICHDMWEEFAICGRCKGFYVGFAFFGAMIATKNTIYIDLLKMIDAYPYLVIIFFVVAIVPIHGALRRLGIIKSKRFLHVTGFIFSSSIYLIGSFIVFLLYGA